MLRAITTLAIALFFAGAAGFATLFAIWPRPVRTITIPAIAAPVPAIRHISAPDDREDWLALVHPNPHHDLRLVNVNTGQVVGPMKIGPRQGGVHYWFNRRGQLIQYRVLEPHHRDSQAIDLIDLEAGNVRELIAPSSKGSTNLLTPNDPDIIAVARGADDRDLTVDVHSAEDGRLLRQLTFPGRRGEIGYTAGKQCACWDLAISPNRRWLALGDGWDNLERMPPGGIEIVDFMTGKTYRRLGPFDDISIRFDEVYLGKITVGAGAGTQTGAAVQDWMNDDVVRLVLNRRTRYGTNGYWNREATYNKYLDVNIHTGERSEPRNDPACSADHPYIGMHSRDGKYRMWYSEFPLWSLKKIQFTDAQWRPLGPWVEFPEEVSSRNADDLYAQFAVGRPAIVIAKFGAPTDKMTELVADWQRWLLGRSDYHDSTVYFWHEAGDVGAREFLRVPTVNSQPATASATIAGKFILLKHDQKSQTATIEVWPLPPYFMPSWPPWVAGGLAFAAVAWRRWRHTLPG